MPAQQSIKQVSETWKRITELAKSGNWHESEELTALVCQALGVAMPTELRAKSPFNEGFPQHYSNFVSQFYLIVPKLDWVGVQRVEAFVDSSREFWTEGLEWRCTRSAGFPPVGKSVNKYNTIAWAEK